MSAGGTKPIAENRRARHDYHLLERYEAGIALSGTEVKSLRAGRADLARAFADLRGNELWLVGAHIDEYAQGNMQNHEPDRDRKLLLHRREIDSLIGKVRERIGSGTEYVVPHNHYRARDGGWIAIACTNDRMFERLAVDAMGQPELQAAFPTMDERLRRRDELDAHV